jgi:hypothetical protein
VKRKLLLLVVFVVGLGAGRSVAHSGPALDGSGTCYGDPRGWVCGRKYTSWQALDRRKRAARRPHETARLTPVKTEGPASTGPSAKTADGSRLRRGHSSG